MHSPGARPCRASSGVESAQAHFQGAVHLAVAWGSGAVMVVQCPPSDSSQHQPAAPQGESGQAPDSNQGWLQPGHPQAPLQAPGSAEKAAPWTGWGWGRAASGLKVRPGPSSAESPPNTGVGPGCILPAAQGCLATLPHGPRGTGLSAAACSELASSPSEGTLPGP